MIRWLEREEKEKEKRKERIDLLARAGRTGDSRGKRIVIAPSPVTLFQRDVRHQRPSSEPGQFAGNC